MPLLMTLGILYPCAAMCSYVVQEKELRARELMKMMGVTDWEIGSSWLLSFWCVQIVSATLVTKVSAMVFENSEAIYLFYFWQLCFLGFVVLSLFMSTMFSKTTRGVLFIMLFVFVGYFMTAVEDVETGNSAIICLLSLHPVAAMAYALQEVGRLEDAGVGITASSIWSTDAPSGYNFADGYLNLVLSNFVLGLLTWYLNRVVQPDYGQGLPLWFPFTLDYWFPGRIRYEEHNERDESEHENLLDNGIPLEPVSDLLKQQARDKENIEIKNLRKEFEEKVAVDGLTLSIYNNQITALLGHNGAGKTTTIGMLTGALSPTGGNATILGNDIRKDMSQIRGNIGVCLQHDVLFPKLTVREHIVFFSRLKGIYDAMTFEEAEASVDQAIRDVALQEKSNTYSQNLSGGMKRKCSLAMAFCGGSKVIVLDEPTSGMDPFSRRFSWNVIRQYKQDRCIILTTHFMDEADILGDRIAIMAEGRLRCCGSSLFLKKTYGVGYQLTIEKVSSFVKSGQFDASNAGGGGISDDDLKNLVAGSVQEATLLSNVGTEMSFQLPLGASDRFVPMLEQLETETDQGRIKAYGVSITTLDEVFLLVARGDEINRQEYESSHFNSGMVTGDSGDREDQRSVQSQMDLEKEDLFATHMGALLKKRVAYFKRDKKAWCCTTILPSLFVLVGLLLLKYAAPKRNLALLPLNLNDYNIDFRGDELRNPIPFNNPNSFFTCNVGRCTSERTITSVETNETYYFCGGAALSSGPEHRCSISNSDAVVKGIDEAGAQGIGGEASNISEASRHVYSSFSQFAASQYGGIFFTHSTNSTIESGALYGDIISGICANNTGDYLKPSECENYGKGFGYTVSYNFTAFHIAPLFQTLADEALIRQVPGHTDMKISAAIHPMPITKREDSFAKAGDAFVLWFLVVLSFPFIAGAFATFVVAERESKAKHIQTVAGVKPTAYWLSTLLWDFTNYLIPFTITVALLFAFNVTVFTTTERHVLQGVVSLLLLFGPAAASLSYCLSFCFRSPSLCNITIIISGFLIGMGASIAALLLNFIGRNPFYPKPRLVTISKVIEWIGRFFPTFCLGKGLLYAINLDAFDFLKGHKLDAWDPEILRYEVIFLAVESIVYPMLAIGIDILSSNPEAMLWAQNFFCFLKGSSDNSAVASIPDDNDVTAEQQRVMNGEANSDAIVMSGLTKVYQNGKIAVDKLSLGIPPGECFGLLGINGAGKTTTMGMLTAEFPPSFGDATLAGFSLRHEPEKTRRRIGYCPQFDALLENLTGREHVELYASIKGIPDSSVRTAASEKLAQVGLSQKDSDRLSANYSGGMKRRLSLACATIGEPQLIFLDECSTGVDPVARREIWQMVSDMVSQENLDTPKSSVILTTHSMEECEALCPRIGIMANGKLRCLGSAQHLKSKFGRGYQLEIRVAVSTPQDEDFQAHRITLTHLKGGTDATDVESVSADAELFFDLPDSRAALQLLCGDDYLSAMLVQDNPIGYGIFKDATSAGGVSLNDLASFVANELRMRNLHAFLLQHYPSAVVRERQDMKMRFEISSKNLSIAQIFASIEDNKQPLRCADYGISQTSLEQVFNLHAAEAERLKEGRMDG